VASLKASLQHDANISLVPGLKGMSSLPAMMAFVDAIAGITFLTTPWVNCQVTPSILNSAARFEAIVYNHSM